jgi:thiol-disulfide isomerase/thioredoxin
VRRLAIAVAIAALSSSGCSAAQPPSKTQPIVAVTPAKFRETIRSMRGKPLVVNFWGTWCDPCKAELPRLARVSKRYAGRVAFLGVDVQDDAQIAASFAARNGVTYRSVGDPVRDVVRSQSILGLPVTQFYAANGKLRNTHRGEIDTDELERFVRRLLPSS